MLFKAKKYYIHVKTCHSDFLMFRYIISFDDKKTKQIVGNSSYSPPEKSYLSTGIVIRVCIRDDSPSEIPGPL